MIFRLIGTPSQRGLISHLSWQPKCRFALIAMLELAMFLCSRSQPSLRQLPFDPSWLMLAGAERVAG